MTTFSYIEVWPPTGWPNTPWREDMEEEAFVKSARSITELYTEALVELRVPGHRSMLRLVCSHVPSEKDVVVTVNTERDVDFESATVQLPTGVAGLSTSARALVVLDVVHGAVLRLAGARNWDKALFEGPRRHVLDAGLQYRWAGRGSRARTVDIVPEPSTA